MDREEIRRLAEEAEADIARYKEEAQQEEAARLAAVVEHPVETKSLDELFTDEATAAPVVTAPQIDAAAPQIDPPAPQADTAAQAEIAQLRSELEKSEVRFKSTFGNFNKSGMAELTEKVKELEAQLAAKTTQEPPKSAMSDEDYEVLVEELGERAANLQRKIFDASVSKPDPEIARLKEELAEISGRTARISHTQAQTETEKYNAQLAQAVPDWDDLMGKVVDVDPQTGIGVAVGQNPLFTSYLNKNGQANFHALVKAQKTGDIATIKAIFDEGRAIALPTAKPAAVAEEEIITEPTRKGAGTPPPLPQQGKRDWTQAKVDEFDRLERAGRLKGTPEQIRAAKDEINEWLLKQG